MLVYSSIIVGGGAAGIFAAIACAEANQDARVLVVEQSLQLLAKVKISGGGRCNVTHACFDPAELVQNYPRGQKELLGPFTRFQPRDVITWFESRGVKLKAEKDGRMFPTTDSSQTIIDCLLGAAKAAGVEIVCGKKVQQVQRNDQSYKVSLADGTHVECHTLMLATGSGGPGHRLAESLGHTIVPPVPSLFTFNVPDSPLLPLSGISVDPATVSLPEFKQTLTGPLLITHWGFSGPAVLKLSAWCARDLHRTGYKTSVHIDWLPKFSHDELKNAIAEKCTTQSKLVCSDPLGLLPKQLWKTLTAQASIAENRTWNSLNKKEREALQQRLKRDVYTLSGKTTYKQEFVTCGGVKLSEVDFKTMESRISPGLYFGGEVLDIDGITGGFNFQAAWTEGWLAGHAMAGVHPKKDR